MTLKQAFAVIRHNCSVNGRIQQHIIIIISYLLTIVSIYANCIVLDMFIILQYHPNDSEWPLQLLKNALASTAIVYETINFQITNY